MENQLIETIFKDEITQEKLEELRSHYPSDLVVDMKNNVEFKAARKTRTERNKLLEAIKRRRIDITNELSGYSKEITDTINDIYDVIVVPFEAEDLARKEAAAKEAEEKEARLNLDRQKIKNIEKMFDEAVGKTTAEISDIIEAVDLIDVDCFDKELIHDAIATKKTVMQKLDAMLSDVRSRELLDKERAKLKQEADEADKKQLIEQRINKLKMIPVTMFGSTEELLVKKIDSLKNFVISEKEFGVSLDDAKSSVLKVVTQLEQMLKQQILVDKAKLSDCDEEAEYKVELEKKDDALEETTVSEEPAVSEETTVSEEPVVETKREERCSRYDAWWHNVGANIARFDNENLKEFNYRIAKTAFNAGSAKE